MMREAPYYHGWLFIVEPDEPKRNLKELYFGREAMRWIDEEQHRLLALVDPSYDRLAATGGEIVRDIHGRFPPYRLADPGGVRFLHTRSA